MARALLAQPEESVTYQPYLYEEAIVRGRIDDAQIERLADELKLDLTENDSWEILDRLTSWL